MKSFIKFWASSLVFKIRRLFPTSDNYAYAGYISHMERRLFVDFILRFFFDQFNDKPDYEAGICTAMKASVRRGDTVVIVGGGYGITLCQAKTLVGPNGVVICYEPSTYQRAVIAKTLQLNGFLGKVEVIAGSVGPEVAVYNNDNLAQNFHPSMLPTCDVLQLDCEGAEIEIIRHLHFRPRAIAVECHGFLGAPSKIVLSQLKRLGFATSIIGVAEPSKAKFCLTNDIVVVLGS